MNLQYISGFFDADGSISMGYGKKGDKFKSIKIDFTNVYLNLLIEIQDYLKDNHDISACICTKPARKDTHRISYSLSVGSNQKCLELCKLLSSHHPTKLHRINTIITYHNKVTRRNGKYSEKEYTRKLAYERLFFSSIFQ